MNSDARKVSEGLYQSFQTVMDSWRPKLAERGITFEQIEHDILDATLEKFTSEVRVMFMRSNDIIDAFEFHLFADGRQLVSSHEVEKWVNEQINTVGVDPE